MVSCVNFTRIASIRVDFHLGTFHGYFFFTKTFDQI